MSAKSQQKSIQSQVLDLNFDLRAETFAAYLDDNVAVQFLFSNYFKRRFSNDIYGIDEGKDILAVDLTRRSFYDIFPERFFHATYSSTPHVNSMVSDYKNRKIEEVHARKFFSPLETEFFLNKVAIEDQEKDIFKSLGSPELVHFLTHLWNIDHDFPKEMAAKILKTMPFMHKIAGNLPLLTRILETIVQENVIVHKEFSKISTLDEQNNEALQLGVNLATIGSGKTYLPKYVFTVHELSNPKNIKEYLPQGIITRVMRFYLEHTLPFECDYEINFTLKDKMQKFVMSDDVYAGRLGISATI